MISIKYLIFVQEQGHGQEKEVFLLMVQQVTSYLPKTLERSFTTACQLSICPREPRPYLDICRNCHHNRQLELLRINHTKLTYTFKVKHLEQPQCIEWQKPYIVNHFLIECGDFAFIRL